LASIDPSFGFVKLVVVVDLVALAVVEDLTVDICAAFLSAGV
jgi:hypothetical protein